MSLNSDCSDSISRGVIMFLIAYISEQNYKYIFRNTFFKVKISLLSYVFMSKINSNKGINVQKAEKCTL